MPSDARRAVLEPLVEACRPKGKTPPEDPRRTLSAILRRHQNGARWRAVPEDLGPWWRAAQIFIRRARAGVRERFLNTPTPCKAWSGFTARSVASAKTPT